ncbi:hypothetical protein RMSM_05489 [Rhodopirellula maiorica SM1]|uniref:Uncharacterized protein n=1 Tax=Rhodopirellula maiorica SM1 TaxID=1265738 RepID=M5REQ1_9BACT|nr:hypothetical protein RMSM_05489 [Rhodopirellula maiorica SM1]
MVTAVTGEKPRPKIARLGAKVETAASPLADGFVYKEKHEKRTSPLTMIIHASDRNGSTVKP